MFHLQSDLSRPDFFPVFKSLDLWNEERNLPISSTSINFEQYLASALHARLKVRPCWGSSCRPVLLDRERRDAGGTWD
eukprot:760664-Hanusia_phi.AAC.5